MEMPTAAQLLEKIEAFLVEHDVSPSRFGREATGESSLVFDLREGRSMTLKSVEKVAKYMASVSAAAAPASGDNGGDLVDRVVPACAGAGL
jgi:hypothetical protein